MIDIAESRSEQGIILAVEHFVGPNVDASLLGSVVLNSQIEADSPPINGLWVPRHLISSPDVMEHILEVARGRDYSWKGHNKDHELEVIYDIAASGGTEDILAQVDRIARVFPAPRMTVTVSITAGEEGIEALQDAYKNRDDIRFILQGLYPEDRPGGVSRIFGIGDTPVTEGLVTQHISELAKNYKLAGMHGFGKLARFALGGQRYVALGVCANGADNYIKERKEHRLSVLKRMCTPEEALTGTEAAVCIVAGRTLFKYMDEYVFESGGKLGLHKTTEIVEANLKALWDKIQEIKNI